MLLMVSLGVVNDEYKVKHNCNGVVVVDSDNPKDVSGVN
jgi:hypothetical protein